MRCQTTELEIETIVNRIKYGDIDLQPDFQRGEIWTTQKKKKLIDSILRGWRIPPIHVVLNSQSIDEVLDGQQRLAAIRDFYDNIICVDGKFEPIDSDIASKDGMFYRDLPKNWQRRFRQYSINVVRLTDYKPDEPAELFYRLNQPAALTSAEQRNAYIGVTRDQVKMLSNKFIALGGTKENLGFSNSRLAYDEIISKFCYSIEIQTLKKKITSTDISEKYRKGEPYSENCLEIAEDTFKKLLRNICRRDDYKFVFNKATLYSWLIFTRQNLNMDDSQFGDLIVNFEFCRAYVKGKNNSSSILGDVYFSLLKQLPYFELMLSTFNQRSSMGTTDVLSIIYRDIIITLFRDALLLGKTKLIDDSLCIFKHYENINSMLDKIVENYNWGDQF